MMTALRKASGRSTRIALDLVHDASEITRRPLIESRLDQDAACIGGKIRKNRPDARKGEIRIVGSAGGRQEQKQSGREVVRSTKPCRSVRRNRHLGARVLDSTSSGGECPRSDIFRAGES